MIQCFKAGSGGIFPFRGRVATCIAGFQYTRTWPALARTGQRTHPDGLKVKSRVQVGLSPTRLLLIGKQDPGFVRKTLQVLRRSDLR